MSLNLEPFEARSTPARASPPAWVEPLRRAASTSAEPGARKEPGSERIEVV